MPTSAYDALIIGAGPAGCAAARLLAAWQHRVLLVDRPGGQSRTLGESIPPSAQKILATVGMLAAVEDAGFTPWRGNTVWWADTPPRVESFASGTAGYQVVRRRFDEILRQLVVQSGADVRTGIVRDVHVPGLGPPTASPEPTATIECDRRTFEVSATFVLDCSGRAGILARRGFREEEPSPRTIALAAAWRSSRRFPDVDATHTLVASYDDGWAWSVSASADERYVTVMIDPARTTLARDAVAREVYLAELRKVAPFARLLEGAALVDGPWGADASRYASSRCAGSDFLLVGDAASFIDPLSSFGVKKALASGWLAAVATHTALRSPAMREHALAFFDRREREIAATAARRASEFAADVAAARPHPFWLARAAGSDDDETADETNAARLAHDPAVVAAFEDLRRRPRIRLQPGRAAQFVRGPAVRGTEIIMDEQLKLPAWPHGLRYLRNVDLVALARLAPDHADVGALYGALVRLQPEVILPDFLGALSVLIARGALEHSE